MNQFIKSKESLIDIGVNLAHKSFNQTLTSVVGRAKDANISKLIITGTSEQASKRGLDICKELSEVYPDMIYTTCGLHPHYAEEFNDETYENLKNIAADKRVVAIGETGLDFNRNYSLPKEQEKAFENQLQLAAELKLPIFLHERDAHKKLLEIFCNYRDSIENAVIHCFTGNKEALFNYLDLDLYIGITGWICDERRGQGLKKIVRNIPINRLMVETDAPYLIPKTIENATKIQVNEPAFLPWVVKEIASHRIESEAEIARQTTINSTEFFNLKKS